jgi:hypothetical protein
MKNVFKLLPLLMLVELLDLLVRKKRLYAREDIRRRKRRRRTTLSPQKPSSVF